MIELEVEFRIGGKGGRNGRERRGAGDGTKPVARGGGADAENRVTTAGGAGIEGTAEGVERRGRLGGEVGGGAEIAVAQENRLLVERLDGAEEPALSVGEVGAEGERGLRALAAAAFGEALAQHGFGAVERALEDVVDQRGLAARRPAKQSNSRGSLFPRPCGRRG